MKIGSGLTEKSAKFIKFDVNLSIVLKQIDNIVVVDAQLIKLFTLL